MNLLTVPKLGTFTKICSVGNNSETIAVCSPCSVSLTQTVACTEGPSFKLKGGERTSPPLRLKNFYFAKLHLNKSSCLPNYTHIYIYIYIYIYI